MTLGKGVRLACILVSLAMAIAVFVGAESPAAGTIAHPWDKVAHFLYYGVMALLLAHGLGRRWWWIALFAVPLVGALDEWHQAAVPGRESSVFDWLADLAGAGAGVGAADWRAQKGIGDGGL
jgi:VanZ family protein